MRFSRKWLQDYVDISKISDVELAEGLTRSGIEVEEVSKLTNVSGIIVAKVIAVNPHPHADKLSICTIDTGSDSTLEVVCGASNVSEYINVAYAPVGAKFGEITIQEKDLRGVVSPGMLCSMEELGIDSNNLEDSQKEGIAILANDLKIGSDVIECLELDDTIFELSLTPNRSDCLSIIGIAYEVSAIFDIPLTKRTILYPEVKNDKKLLNLLVSNKSVKRFSLMPLHDIKIKQSPQFIKTRLIACGIKPINNVVDITNYILIETGQPLHAFDLEKCGVDFEVRSGFKNEKIKLLDESEIEVCPDDIMVATQEDALSLAGVMGGFDSRITNYTENIVLECAVFESEAIRQTSKKHALRSDSSVRFEKGIDINRSEIAMKMAVELLVKYAGAKLSVEPVTYTSDDFGYDESEVELTYEKLTKYIGFDIDVQEVAKILDRLQLKYRFENSTFKVNKLSRRPDIQFDVCIIEEVLRLYGVDNIEGVLPTVKVKSSHISEYDHILRNIKFVLHSLGYSETINYSLTSEEKASINLCDNEQLIKIVNPLSSEREFLRKSLIPSLVDAAAYNLERQVNDVRLYEISQVNYILDGEYTTHSKIAAIISGFTFNKPLFDINIKGDFYFLKGLLQKLFATVGLKEGLEYSVEPCDDIPSIFHPYQSAQVKLFGKHAGYIGRVHPKYSKHELYTFEIDFNDLKNVYNDNLTLGTISVYPAVNRDLSIVVDSSVRSIDMIRAVHDLNIDVLEDIYIYNIYNDEQLEGKKSLTFRLRFRSEEKTLSENDISSQINLIINCFKENYNGDLR